MVEEFNDDIPKISPIENGILIVEFSEKEVFEVISQLEHNKAPRLDGFVANFYQCFWDVIKSNLMAIHGFGIIHRDLPLFKVNFRVILLPKKEDASRIDQYRLIC
jgi:hypothetical protein